MGGLPAKDCRQPCHFAKLGSTGSGVPARLLRVQTIADFATRVLVSGDYRVGQVLDAIVFFPAVRQVLPYASALSFGFAATQDLGTNGLFLRSGVAAPRAKVKISCTNSGSMRETFASTKPDRVSENQGISAARTGSRIQRLPQTATLPYVLSPRARLCSRMYPTGR
jgi:hypothetical protein